MRRLIAATLITATALLASSVSAQQKNPLPRLVSADLPQYPPLARGARIEGIVRLAFVLNEQGEVARMEVICGHRMLATAATENVKSWKFEFPPNFFTTQRRYETAFVYQLSDKPADANPKLTVSLATFERVEITSDGPAVYTNYSSH
jgi:TonB family protein